MGNALSRVTGKAQKALSDYRGNTLKRNFGLWKQGSLNNTFGKSTRNIGQRLGAAQQTVEATGSGGVKTFFSTSRSQISGQGVDAQVADEMLKRDGGKFAGFDELNEEHHRLGVGATKAQLATALIARFAQSGKTLSQEDAKQYVDQYEQSFGGQVGSTQMVLAAVKAASASSTAHREEIDKDGNVIRTQDQAVQALRDGLSKLVSNKSITLTQAAAIMTSNKTRLDLAGAGFAATMGFINPNGEKGAAENMQDFKDAGIAGNTAYSLFGQRWETARASATHMKQQLDDLLSAQKAAQAVEDAAISGATPDERAQLESVRDGLFSRLEKRNLMKDRAGNKLNIKQAITRQYAEIDSGYQVAKNLAPLNAQQLSDILMNYKPEGSNQPVYQAIVDEKRTNPEMARYGYEFLQASGGSSADPRATGPTPPPPGAPGAPPTQPGSPFGS